MDLCSPYNKGKFDMVFEAILEGFSYCSRDVQS
jgi:hypothetical protein